VFSDGGAATSSSLCAPNDVALTASGDLLIADTDWHRIRRVSNGVISTIAGGHGGHFNGDNAAVDSALFYPRGVAVDARGGILITDTNNNRIRRIHP
jgi:sugar lactone lactonase YvrE